MDFVDNECVVAAPLDADATARTGEDPALAKLIRKLEVCDAEDDADERRQFVAKHAKAMGQSVDVVLARLRAAGALSAEEVRDWDGKAKEEELVIVLAPDVPPSELRPADAKEQAAPVSNLHKVPAGGEEKLRSLLAARGLTRHLALLDERGFDKGEWFADYAVAVLSPSSRCSSEPAWVAWAAWQRDESVGTDATAVSGAPRGELLLLCNAEDQSAARRSLLALELRRAATVRVIAWPRPWLPQLERLARELQRELVVEAECDEDGETGQKPAHDPTLPVAARPGGARAARGECWVRLAVPSDDTSAAEVAGQGAEAAAARAEAALGVLRELSRRLRQRDPESRVEAAPDGPTGRFMINHVRYNSRVLRWVGKVDGDTDVDALQRVIQTSLDTCC